MLKSVFCIRMTENMFSLQTVTLIRSVASFVVSIEELQFWNDILRHELSLGLQRPLLKYRQVFHRKSCTSFDWAYISLIQSLLEFIEVIVGNKVLPCRLSITLWVQLNICFWMCGMTSQLIWHIYNIFKHQRQPPAPFIYVTKSIYVEDKFDNQIPHLMCSPDYESKVDINNVFWKILFRISSPSLMCTLLIFTRIIHWSRNPFLITHQTKPINTNPLKKEKEKKEIGVHCVQLCVHTQKITFSIQLFYSSSPWLE